MPKSFLTLFLNLSRRILIPPLLKSESRPDHQDQNTGQRQQDQEDLPWGQLRKLLSPMMTAMDLFLQPEDLSGTDQLASLTGDLLRPSGGQLKPLRSSQGESESLQDLLRDPHQGPLRPMIHFLSMRTDFQILLPIMAAAGIVTTTETGIDQGEWCFL